MSGWDDLAAELDSWAAAGRTATLWWRDDDAVAPSASLDRLLALQAQYDVPVTLAVIPAGATPALAHRLAGRTGVSPVQHGFAHRDHSRAGAKSGELGPERPRAEVLAELAAGQLLLAALFGASLRPLLVPPWNRIAASLVAGLPELGFRALSTFGPRPTRHPVPRLLQVNAHVDIVDWRRDRAFIGEARALGRIIEHLGARRAGAADPSEPTGLLTHHLVHHEPAWAFLAELMRRTQAHPAARWLAADRVMAEPAKDLAAAAEEVARPS